MSQMLSDVIFWMYRKAKMEKTEHLRLEIAANMFSTYMFMVLLNLWWPSGDKIDIKFSITVQRIHKATVGILNCKWVNADLFFPTLGSGRNMAQNSSTLGRGGLSQYLHKYLKLGE